MEQAILSLHTITRIYHQGDRDLTVLDRLDLDVRKGVVVALLGPSGSGKSTLLQIAGLLDTPDSGEVTVGGEVLSVAALSLALSFLATIYPARRAASLDPAEALRYE